MALKFRRGTTAQKSGSLAFGEPFVNTDLNTLQIGGPSGDITLGTTGESSAFAGVSVSASSFISGSALKITGNAAIDGNLTLGGAITIGDATADTVNVVASLSSSLIPSDDNKFDVGRNDKRYRGIYTNTLSASVLEIESSSWVEIRLKNSSTGIDYHIQNTAGGNFSIHNAEINASTFRIDSGSTLAESHVHVFADLYVSTGSIHIGTETTSPTGSFGILRATDTISGSITGIGNVSAYSSSVNSRLVVVEGVSASAAGALNSVSGAFATTLSNLDTNYATDAQLSSVSGAFVTTISNLGSTYATDSELSAVSSAVAVRDAAQDVLISSLQSNILSASVFTTFSTSVDSRLDVVEGVSASAASALNSVSGAFATRVAGIDSTISSLSTSVDSRLDVVEGVSASAASALNSLSSSASSAYAKVGAANTFNGNQTISGSLFVTQDLILGGSASIQHVTSSQLNISDNIITVNTINPTVRFGGLAVIDSGSAGISGSFLYDSVQDEFVFVHKGDGTNVTSSHFLVGPETYNDLGNETYLAANKVLKSKGNEHVAESNITDNGSLITLGSNTSVTGTLVATGTALVSGSAQITISSTTGYSTFSSSIATTISNLGSTYATDAELSSVSGAFATTIGNLDNTYATDASVTSVSGAFATTIGNLGNTYATDAELSSVSGAVATTIANLGSTYATDAELSTVSGAFATTIGNLDSTYATDASVTSVSGAFATTISNLGSTYATDAELSSVSGAIATRDAGQDTTISTLSSSVASRLGTLETKDITITLTGDVTGTGTITDLGNVSFATTVAANSVALGTDTTGNYMSDVSAGTGVSVSHTPGEGSTATISIGQAVGTTSNVTFGNVTATGTVSGSTFTGLGNLTTYSSSVASRLVTLEGKDFTITLTGDVTGTGTVTDLGNVSFATTIAADSVALGTDTTGNYVSTITAGTGVSSTGATTGEGIAHTISIGQAVATSSNVQFNSLGVGMAASATAGRIDATNDIVAFSSSDIRFKENIKPIENPIEKIRKISGNTYDWKEENKIEHGYEGNDVGVIAQEIEAVLPQLVQTRESGYKAVKYDKLVALLIEGIKEQQLQIEKLQLEVEDLKKQKGL